MKPRVQTLALCPLAVAAVCAQNSPVAPQPEIASREAPVTFSSKVNLVSVAVVVRDSKGRAVGNLRQEDFRLFDKGKPQVIARFSMQAGALPGALPGAPAGGPTVTRNSVPGSQPATPPPDTANPALPDHYVAYIFDDIHLAFGDLAHMKIAAEKHFAETLDPNSRAAIFTTSGRVFLDFTADRDKLHDTLSKLRVGPSALLVTLADREDQVDPCPPKISPWLADQAVNVGDRQAINAAEDAAVKCWVGPDPGPPAWGIMASHQVLTAMKTDTQNTASSLAALIRRIATMPGRRSIVLISPGFLFTTELRSLESDLMDAAVRSNVTLNTLDVRGLYTLGSAENHAYGDTLKELAEGTGGRAFHDDNGFAEGLRLLAAPPEFTYILAFCPQNLKYDGSYHRLKVSLVNSKGLEVQARRGYWAPNHAVDPTVQAKEEIREAVFSLEEIRDIPVDVTTEFFKLSDATAELTVASRLDINGVKFKAAEGRNEDTLTVVTGLFDQDGHYVKGTQRVIDLRLRDQTLERLLGAGMNVKETFEIPPGRYVVRVVVRDREGEAMAAGNGTVEIP